MGRSTQPTCGRLTAAQPGRRICEHPSPLQRSCSSQSFHSHNQRSKRSWRRTRQEQHHQYGPRQRLTRAICLSTDRPASGYGDSAEDRGHLSVAACGDGQGIGKRDVSELCRSHRLPTVKKKVLLICPGVFEGYLEWEGVPLSVLLEKAKAQPDFTRVSFRSYEGYTERFSREEATKHLLFLHLR